MNIKPDNYSENKFSETKANPTEIKSSGAQPSPSPAQAFAKLVVQELRLLRLVEAHREELAEQIAEELFEITINATDEEITTGTIQLLEDEEIDPVTKRKRNRNIKILNRLFQLSRSGNGVINLTPTYLERFDKKSHALLTCLGMEMPGVFCNTINEENRARTPSASMTVVAAAVLNLLHQNKGQER